MADMLAPAAVLVLWSLVMLFWMARTRFPAMAKSGFKVGEAKPGGRGQDLEGVLPDEVNWKAHNYAHLMEQPTIFYPTVVIIALIGANIGDVIAAWLYVGLRIVHSIYQATRNVIRVRLMLFQFSTFALVYLAIRALYLTVFAGLAA